MLQFFKSLFAGPLYESISEAQFRNVYSNNKNTHVFDVRTAGEYNSGHIKKAINADIMGNGFSEALRTYNHRKNDVFLVYCRSGARSAAACKRLKQEGFEHVYNLRGGIAGWRGSLAL